MPGPDRNKYIRRFMENYGEEVIPPLGERVSEYMPWLEDAIQTIRRWIKQRTGVAAAAPKTSEDQLMDLINMGMPGAPIPEGFTRETWAEAQAGARRALAAMTGQPTGPLQPVPSAEEEWGRGRRKVSQDIYTDTEERMRRADEIMAQLEPKKAYLPLVGTAPPERQAYLPLVGAPVTQTGRTPPMMEPPQPIPRRVSQRTPQMLEPGQEMTRPPTVLTWELIGEWLAPLVQAMQENAGNAIPEGARGVPAGVGMGANAAPMPSAMSWLGSLLPQAEGGQPGPTTERSLLVDQDAQHMYVYDNGRLVRTIPISTGDPSRYRTPAWEGTVGGYVPTFSSYGTQSDTAWHLFKDAGNILMHGAPYTVNEAGEKEYQGLEELGKVPTSHGCIRMHPDDAEWLKSWDPTNVPITITSWTGGSKTGQVLPSTQSNLSLPMVDEVATAPPGSNPPPLPPPEDTLMDQTSPPRGVFPELAPGDLARRLAEFINERPASLEQLLTPGGPAQWLTGNLASKPPPPEDLLAPPAQPVLPGGGGGGGGGFGAPSGEAGGVLGWLRSIVDTMRTPPEERLLPGSPFDQRSALFGAPSAPSRSPVTGARVPLTADEIGIAGPSLRDWLREGNAPAASPKPFGDTEGGGSSTGGGSTTGGSGGGPVGGGPVGGGVDPAMEAWWNEFMYRHGGENPVEYYGGTWGRSSDEALAEALWDKAWGEDFARKHGQSPSEDTWKESYYAREAMKRAALANTGKYDPWYAQAPW